MGLYERLMGFEQPKLPVHQFMGAMQEISLGNMTGAQGVTAFGLSPAEATEASTLQATIAAEPTAVEKKVKAMEVERVLFLAEQRLVPFDTPAAVKTRLGV